MYSSPWLLVLLAHRVFPAYQLSANGERSHGVNSTGLGIRPGDDKFPTILQGYVAWSLSVPATRRHCLETYQRRIKPYNQIGNAAIDIHNSIA
jgi:hypothetical protein